MPTGNGVRSRLDVILAGLESGILGGAAMLVWLSAVSVWQGRSMWGAANLLATTFYGEVALRRGFRWSTVSGLALHFVLTALLGVAFGWAVSGTGKRAGVMLLGLAAGLVSYYLIHGLVWRHVNPLIPLHSPEAATLVGHLALGTFLGRFPRYLRDLAA